MSLFFMLSWKHLQFEYDTASILFTKSTFFLIDTFTQIGRLPLSDG